MKLFESLETVRLGNLSLSTLLSAVLVALVCLIVIQILKRLVNRLAARSRLEQGMKTFITSVLSLLFWIVAVIIVADTLGIPTASLVALLSVIGLAFSLSMQGILTNVFSGVTILLTKPFKVGDYIAIDDSSGYVERIGLFHTQLRTLDNREIFLPNGDVAASRIVNWLHVDELWCAPVSLDVILLLPFGTILSGETGTDIDIFEILSHSSVLLII